VDRDVRDCYPLAVKLRLLATVGGSSGRKANIDLGDGSQVND
jgi:hypothetical protein